MAFSHADLTMGSARLNQGRKMPRSFFFGEVLVGALAPGGMKRAESGSSASG